MTESAGIVNDQGRARDAAFNKVISDSDAEVQALARAVRDLVYDVLPQTCLARSARCGDEALDSIATRLSRRSRRLPAVAECADPDAAMPTLAPVLLSLDRT